MRHLIYLLAKGAPERLYHTASPNKGARRITHSAVIELKLRRMLGTADEAETKP